MHEPEDLKAFYSHMARLLNTGDGKDLLEWLEAKYVAPRQIVTEHTPAGIMQRYVRTTLAGESPYETYRRIGHMDVINTLKDLQEWLTT